MAAALEKGRIFRIVAGLFFLTGSLNMAVDYAGDVFSLEIWKLTIPIDDDGDGIADEVLMPVLRKFEDPEFFHLSGSKDSIIFRVAGADPATGDPGFLLCGLRELVKKSKTPAAWGSNDGRVHQMTILFAFNAAPKANVRVVAAGIYADEEPVISIHLENGNVQMTGEGLDPLMVSEGYMPGHWIDLMLIVDQGRIRILKDLKEIGEWPLEGSELHFRVGCDVQIDSETAPEEAGFGEVEIRKLFVTHKPH